MSSSQLLFEMENIASPYPPPLQTTLRLPAGHTVDRRKCSQSFVPVFLSSLPAGTAEKNKCTLRISPTPPDQELFKAYGKRMLFSVSGTFLDNPNFQDCRALPKTVDRRGIG